MDICMDNPQETVINDRRNHKERGNILLSLVNNIHSIQTSWTKFSKIKVKDQQFMEELSEILINVNYIKELCINKRMHGLSIQVEELETALIELIDFPKIGDKLLYQAIILKMSDVTNNINQLYQQYQNLESFGSLKEFEKQEIPRPVEIYNKHVFIISNDNKFIEECSHQILHYSYTSETFGDYKELINSENTPAAIIIDLDIFQEKKNLKDFHLDFDQPIIVVSSNSDFKSRLLAVQANSVAFFTKPVNASSLLDKLDSIIYSAVMEEPPKVLVIDDSKTISEYLYKTLTKAGMVVHVETTPEAALNVIGSFNPDLILMDMYMPVCNGEDLCKIIRQYESFTSIPIVFLSSEADVQKQLNAMKIGADDFLTKGIDPQHLITSIIIRIQRHRVLSSFMIKDSLTGLLNHTTSKKQLESMIAKAQKLNVPLSFGMIDIDNFKKVNDTYGHPTGDKVIKSLSRLLQKRLRKTDSIGRYGGEEFAVVLWNTDANNAKKILDEIREDFSKIEHFHEGVNFFTTFSSGVANFPNFTNGADLSSAADKALYVAKRQGRNQVCISQDNEPLEQ
jgi:diguanylate cyclase (GGDEF)-like protein